MKILILNWRYIFHPWTGGAERHIHELATQWTKKGHHVTILCGGFAKAPHRETINGIHIIRLGDTYTIYLLAPIYYIFFLRKKKFDVIISVAHGLPFFTPLFTRRNKIIIIHQNHEELWKTEWGGIISRLGIFIENKIMPFIYRNIPVVTLSESTKYNLESLGFQKVYAIPPGILVPNTIHKLRKSKTPTILYLGRIRKYKRVDFLLQIFPQIQNKIPHVNLIIAGDGQDKSRIEHIIRAKNIKNVEVKGWVSDSEKYELLTTSWTLAFPSKIEGWGLVSLEAAACGTPTIAFKVPGLEDAVKNNESGILVKNQKEFTEAVIIVLSNRQLREKFSNLSKKWANKFRWDKSAESVMKIINDNRK
jgi:glycosyltransferase involved in cell wall biosynthesis